MLDSQHVDRFLEDVTVTHGMGSPRVHASIVVPNNRFDTFRDNIVEALIEKLAQDPEVGRERAENGTLHEFLGGMNGLSTKIVLVAAPE